MNVLVDSSVWISADRKNSLDHSKLKKLIARPDVEVCVSQPIRLEVCQGARTPEEFDYLWSGFQGFKNSEITEFVWRESALNFMRYRRRGLTLTTLDCLIATLAHYYSVPLWSTDKIFTKISAVVPFEPWK